MATMDEKTLLGDPARKKLSCQAGFLPVPLHSVPPETLAGLAVFILRDQEYSLYRNVDVSFGVKDCQRLLDSGIEFVFVAVKDHQVYYRTMEKCLGAIVSDKKIQIQKKAEMIYSTSIELAQELLCKPPQKEEVDRTHTMSLSMVKMIIGDKQAFNHLFELSDHDFLTATHAVNVCTTTIALADRMGLTDQKLLQNLGSGALLHDIGKIFIDSELLNTTRPITPEEREMLKKHVDLGREHLEKVGSMPEEILQVVAQHHERIDGSGYPRGLKGEEISLLGRLAGIVDTFDAMTSARPYREHTFSVDEVLDHLTNEAKAKFDPVIVRSFNAMIEQTLHKQPESDGKTPQTVESQSGDQGDGNAMGVSGDRRFRIPMWISRIVRKGSQLIREESQRMIVHNMNRSGLSYLSPKPIELDQNIFVSMMRGPKKEICNFLAVVTRCHDYGDGWFTVTAKFHDVQPSQTIEKINSLMHPAEKINIS
jgi:putative nucleotidyltransferase with HDIG domain